MVQPPEAVPRQAGRRLQARIDERRAALIARPGDEPGLRLFSEGMVRCIGTSIAKAGRAEISARIAGLWRPACAYSPDRTAAIPWRGPPIGSRHGREAVV